MSLFFVLSAFLLSLPFLAEAEGGKRVDRSRYFARRALRILPLYYAAVVVGAVMTARQPADLLRGLPYLAFLNAVAGWSTSLAPYSSVWWSLATEAQFYVLLPLLPYALRSRRGRIGGGLALGAYLALYGAYLSGWFHLTVLGEFLLPLSIFGRAPLFLCGIAVAWLYRRTAQRGPAAIGTSPWFSRGGADVVLFGVLIGLWALLRWRIEKGSAAAETPPFQAWHILEGLLWAAVVGVVLLTKLRTAPLLSNRFLAYLGVTSYSLYMWHLPLHQWSKRGLEALGMQWTLGSSARNAAVSLGVSAVCLLAASISYRLIERPFLVRKEKL